MMPDSEFSKLIEKYLGRNGRMISLSKSGYRESHPKSVVYFNACIYDDSPKQIWYGDIDVTLDRSKLEKLAKVYGKKFFVTPEHPFRSDFNNVTKEQLLEDEYVLKFNGDKNE